jgi:hypothetical protein
MNSNINILKIGLASFAAFILIDRNNILDPNKAFVSLSLFNIMSELGYKYYLYK